MQFRAEQYYRASLERMKQATRLYRDGTAFALTIYCGGLAVESLLRAFRWTHNPTFEGRHDLSDLLKASRLFTFDDDYMHRRGKSDLQIGESRRSLKGAMNEVIALWHNDQRFASEASIVAYLKKIDRFQGVKGDPLKKNALELIDAAQTVVARGTVLWDSEIRLESC